MKQKSTNQITNDRTCVVTRKKKSKDQLLRLYKVGNTYKIDIEKNKNGRGIYISDDKSIIKKCIDNNILGKKYKLESKNSIDLNKELLIYYEKKHGKE